VRAGTRDAGFDTAADRYDSDEFGNAVISHMRERVFEHLRLGFPYGAQLIELGSGTGREAVRLAEQHGCRIALVDVSPRLLDLAVSKVRAARADAVIGSHLLEARRIGDLTKSYGSASFDGAYSNFGPLNCEPHLGSVAEGLADLLRPRGGLVISIMNRWCAIEFLWFALHGQPREALRRWRRGPVQSSAYPGGPKDVATWYYSRLEIERAFSTPFRLDHTEALPVLWPPPYLDFMVKRFGTLFQALEPIERWAAKCCLLRDLGDHLLFRFTRR
jgi:SAM-dependent methyltransferase